MGKANNQQKYLDPPSQFIESKVRIRRPDSSEHYEAKLYNYNSQGGLYLKTQIPFIPGNHVYLHFDTLPPEFKNLDFTLINCLLVVWCKELLSEQGFPFNLGTKWGIGTCDLCNADFRMEELNLTPDLVYLCPLCYYKLEKMPGSRIKKSLNRFLVGNVL